MLFERRFRRSRTCIGWFGQPWLASVRYEPPIMAEIAGSAHTDWAGITKGRFVCCAINTLGRVVVACKPLAQRGLHHRYSWPAAA